MGDDQDLEQMEAQTGEMMDLIIKRAGVRSRAELAGSDEQWTDDEVMAFIEAALGVLNHTVVILYEAVSRAASGYRKLAVMKLTTNRVAEIINQAIGLAYRDQLGEIDFEATKH